MDHYEILKKLIDSQETGKRKKPSYIYLDEKDNQIKEIPLSKMDSSASAYYINNIDYNYNALKLIHDSIFG